MSDLFTVGPHNKESIENPSKYIKNEKKLANGAKIPKRCAKVSGIQKVPIKLFWEMVV